MSREGAKRSLEQEDGGTENNMFAFKGEEEFESNDSDLDLDTIRRPERGKVKPNGYSSESEPDNGRGPLSQRAVEEELIDEEAEVLSPSHDKEFVLPKDNEDAVPMEPFNMKSELEEGEFDRETGSYVWQKDASTQNDAWLSSITNESIQKAKEAKEMRERELMEKATQPVAPLDKLLEELVTFLELGESPLEAIHRRKPVVQKKFDAKSRRLAARQSEEEIAQDERKRRDIDRITAICGHLMDKELPEVYDLSKEELMRLGSRN